VEVQDRWWFIHERNLAEMLLRVEHSELSASEAMASLVEHAEIQQVREP
jgi:hypothetical protein